MGNGFNAENVSAYLDYFNINYEGHVISENYEKNNVGEHPVYYLSKIEPDDKTGIILGCLPIYYNEVVPELLKRGFKNLFFGSAIFEIGYAIRKLESLGVDLSKPVLDMKEFSTANLFPYAIEDYRACVTYAAEFPDLGYHYLGEKYCFDEGPYEFENVILDDINFNLCAKYINLKKDGVVFDCGANIGMFSTIAAGKGCEVYAFEPAPAQYKYWEKNQALYPDLIHIVPKAVSDYNGEAQFNLCPQYNGGDSLVNEFAGGETVSVEVTTLDCFAEENKIERVGFIKADLEGAERMLLIGAAQILKKDKPVLSLCTYHRQDDVRVLTNIIKEINPDYKITYGRKKLYAWVENE